MKKEYIIDNLKAEIRENKITNAFGKYFQWNSKIFFLIFGEHINGGFSALPNKKVSCEMSSYDDKFYNTERLSQVVKGKSTVKMLVDLIANYNEYNFSPVNARELSIDYLGYNFLVIFGKYADVPFCIIPNWRTSFIFESFGNIDKNTKTINSVLKNNKTAHAIATVIAIAADN